MQGPIPVTLPHTPGIDVAGTVDALGEGVDGFEVGDQVVGFLPMTGAGAAAEYVVAPAEILTRGAHERPAGRRRRAAAGRASPRGRRCSTTRSSRPGQRVLINGAGGAVGGYAVQLAKNAGAYVIATASPRSSERVKDGGRRRGHRPHDHRGRRGGDRAGRRRAQPRADRPGAAGRAGRPGPATAASLVNTTVWMPAPSDEERGVRGIDLFVRSDAEQLAQLVALVDRGELRVEVAERVPLAELPALHARAAAGELPGKVVITVAG